MKYIRADIKKLQTACNNLSCLAEEISAEHNTINKLLTEIIAQWDGAAAQDFGANLVKELDKLNKVNESINALREYGLNRIQKLEEIDKRYELMVKALNFIGLDVSTNISDEGRISIKIKRYEPKKHIGGGKAF